MSGFSSAGLRSLRRQNRDTLDTDLTFYHDGVALPPQRVALRRVSQQELPDGEVMATPGGVLEIRGGFDLDIRSGYRFTWDGLTWKVVQVPVATETNTSIARRALAVSEGKSA